MITERDQVIEECAKLCEERAVRSDRARGGMGKIFAQTQDMEALNIAAALRSLKTEEVKELPNHLQEMRFATCVLCGRKSWSVLDWDKPCGMIQPGGKKCEGMFVIDITT